MLGLKWKSHDLDLVALKEKIASLEIEKESINANRLEIETKIEKLRVSLSDEGEICLLYTSPSPRDNRVSRMPSSA